MNDEIRMPNAETNPNLFAAIAERKLVIGALLFLRNSLFVIRHF